MDKWKATDVGNSAYISPDTEWYKADEVADLARRVLEEIKHLYYILQRYEKPSSAEMYKYLHLKTDLEQIVKEGE